MYIIRLDDASEYMDIRNWTRMEKLFDRYSVKPLVGVIPNNKDASMVNIYDKDIHFWDKARNWQSKGWSIALHGYTHVYISNDGGVNPINPRFEFAGVNPANHRSEFAGVPLEIQIEKIAKGIKIFERQGISTNIFFAPSHTFDWNTLEALRISSDINIISDGIANDVIKKEGFYFIPQQSGKVRKLPVKLTTFCYHPNTMEETDFKTLEDFLEKNHEKFTSVENIDLLDRSPSLYDVLLDKLYFLIRR